MRTRSWHLLAAVAMLGVLGVLATLQYRWLGEVGRAERERLEASLRARAADFTGDVDRDLTRLYALLQVDAEPWNADPVSAAAAALERARQETLAGRAVSALYLAESGPSGALLRRIDPETRTLAHAEWPADMAGVRRRLEGWRSRPALPVPAALLGDALDPDVPALIVPIVALDDLDPVPDGTRIITSADRPVTSQALVARLDVSRLKDEAIAPLASRHFGDASRAEYLVSVVRSDGIGAPVYQSDAAAPLDPRRADLVRDIFALRVADLRWTRALPPGAGSEGLPARDRVAITIVRRDAGERPATDLRALEPAAAWRVLVQARRGSLDAVVSRSRMRNMGISLGVLALLGASVGLVLASAAREQQAARQQIEFVASVSHELRTPLAVIRSAAENLADGVVAHEQVKDYGALIRTEGRRLSDMVERVMEFAGMTAGTPRAWHALSIRDVLVEAIAAVAADARERGQIITVSQPDVLSPVSGDAQTLRSALQNALGNALKYSGVGSPIEVSVTEEGGRIRITVRDRGQGIDPDDLPHVFTPFFRGRRAVASQVRGSGVGLSVVQKVVQAHGGAVHIANREGGGTELSIELPPASGEQSS